MLSVIDAMNASAGFTRPMREGEEVLKGGLVVGVGKKSKEDEVVHVQALVLRTSGLKTDPAVVELWVDLSRDYGERTVKDNEEEFRKHCDCPAGNSEKCKHVVAVMLYLTRLVPSTVVILFLLRLTFSCRVLIYIVSIFM